MLPMPNALGASQQRLINLFNKLSDRDKDVVIGLAELLAGKAPDAAVQETVEPGDTPRPAKESVVAAMRRLSGDYPMLKSSQLLHEASSLMSQHMLQGKEAPAVIDQLEALFIKHYQLWKDTL